MTRRNLSETLSAFRAPGFNDLFLLQFCSEMWLVDSLDVITKILRPAPPQSQANQDGHDHLIRHTDRPIDSYASTVAGKPKAKEGNGLYSFSTKTKRTIKTGGVLSTCVLQRACKDTPCPSHGAILAKRPADHSIKLSRLFKMYETAIASEYCQVISDASWLINFINGKRNGPVTPQGVAHYGC